MNKVLSKLPLPGRKPRASERLAGNNNWKEQPDFTTALSDSEDDGGAVLTSANLRAHKGRPVTNEGQRLKRGLENAKEWVDQSPAPKKGPGKALDDDSSEDSSPYAASSRLDPASSRLGAQTDEDAGRRGGIRPFHAPAAQDDDGDSGEDDQPLGQTTKVRQEELPVVPSVYSRAQGGIDTPIAQRVVQGQGRKPDAGIVDQTTVVSLAAAQRDRAEAEHHHACYVWRHTIRNPQHFVRRKRPAGKNVHWHCAVGSLGQKPRQILFAGH